MGRKTLKLKIWRSEVSARQQQVVINSRLEEKCMHFELAIFVVRHQRKYKMWLITATWGWNTLGASGVKGLVSSWRAATLMFIAVDGFTSLTQQWSRHSWCKLRKNTDL